MTSFAASGSAAAAGRRGRGLRAPGLHRHGLGTAGLLETQDVRVLVLITTALPTGLSAGAEVGALMALGRTSRKIRVRESPLPVSLRGRGSGRTAAGGPPGLASLPRPPLPGKGKAALPRGHVSRPCRGPLARSLPRRATTRSGCPGSALTSAAEAGKEVVASPDLPASVASAANGLFTGISTTEETDDFWPAVAGDAALFQSSAGGNYTPTYMVGPRR